MSSRDQILQLTRMFETDEQKVEREKAESRLSDYFKDQDEKSRAIYKGTSYYMDQVHFSPLGNNAPSLKECIQICKNAGYRVIKGKANK